MEVRAVTPREGQKYNMDNGQGVAITKVDPKGALGEAGFEVGDIILGIENQPIAGVNNFIELVSVVKPGQKMTILALDHRSGNVGNVEVTAR